MNAAFLTRRELEALAFLARFRFLTRTQLQEFMFSANGYSNPNRLSTQTMTFRILNSLQTKRLVARTNRSVGGPIGGSGAHAYFATNLGIRTLDDRHHAWLPKRTPPKGTFLLRHALATADIALGFERAAKVNAGHSVLTFECDWEAATRTGQSIVVPDAFLIYATKYDELHAFIEVDLGTVGSKLFARKVSNYLDLLRSGKWKERFDLWPTVLVVCPTDRRAGLLRRTTETVLASQPDSKIIERATEFAFASLTLIKQEGPLAQIWQIAGKAGTQPLLKERPI